MGQEQGVEVNFLYLGIVLIFSATVCLLLWRQVRQLRMRNVLRTALVLSILTLVFDNIIVGLDLVDYDRRRILGLKMPIAPIEDLGYAFLAAVMVPALWLLFAKLGKKDD
ncbi:MAG: hypothetical protein RJA26_1157 [Actinomycetota bacterium]